ncbi:DNA-directed RNA polymerases II and IV subunit 5A-like [Vicia villosa]|uniref:DNA-directed RNA polymerases II and IV subunit 5A-like n=1 Tax=Vicia villosa TaxID=3911 RepID=UPI00273BDE4A|nr:DNA-directed RNA polymerases II and IV subunit 5A-like [Vicia villosa]
MVYSEEEIPKLHRVHRTVLQMLRDRNYLVLDSEINMSRQEFKEKLDINLKGGHPTYFKTNKDDPSDKIFVYFVRVAKLGLSVLTKIRERMESEGVERSILVSRSKPSEALKDLAPKHRIELFQEDELLVNVTEHELVPEHQVLTEAEKENLLETYTVKETQLPRMFVTDPVARYYGLKRGQVVRIIRPSETAGTYVTYRIVV